MKEDPMKEYLTYTEPGKREKAYAWNTAIGLQAVDGLKPSQYLLDLAAQNIDGQISITEAQKLLNSYYEQNRHRNENDRTEEADKVSARITEILSEPAFSFTPNEYLSIHRKLFSGIYSHAGKIRDYNITKKEWVLNGATVLYGSASELSRTLEYDFDKEKGFDYKNLTVAEVIRHIALFICGIWQIHVFGEGNTRATAVFLIKYLRTLGFNATNDTFAENAWYFRNALVRANYNDLQNGIHETTEYLELFLRNAVLNENNELHNRTMHINYISQSDIPNVTLDVTLNETEISVFAILKNNPNVSRDEIAHKISKTVRTVQRTLNSLREKQYIERIGSKQKPIWRVLKYSPK